MLGVQRKLYLRILDFLYKFLEKIPIKLRDLLCQASFLVTMIIYMINCDIYRFSFKTRNLIYIFCMLFALICLYNGKGEKIKNERSIILTFYIMGIGCTISGIANNMIGYVLYGVIFLLIYPFVMIIVNAIDKKHLFLLLSKCMIIFWGIIVVCSMLFEPLTQEQYASVLDDPNSLGLVCVCTLICSLYLERYSDRKILYDIVCATAIVFCLFSRSRTSQLVMILVLMVDIFFVFKRKERWKRFLPIGVSLFIVFMGSYIVLSALTPILVETSKKDYVNENNNSLENELENNEFSTTIIEENNSTNDLSEENSAGNNQIGDIWESKENNFEENNNDSSNNVLISEVIEGIVDRNLQGIANDSDFTSGRTSIWKAGIEQLNFFGHESELISNTKYFYRPMYAHNGILQIGYSMGLVAMIGFFMLVVINGIDALILLFKRNSFDDEVFFEICVIGSFSIFTMLYSMYSPFSDPLSFIYYLVVLNYKEVIKNKKKFSIGEK